MAIWSASASAMAFSAGPYLSSSMDNAAVRFQVRSNMEFDQTWISVKRGVRSNMGFAQTWSSFKHEVRSSMEFAQTWSSLKHGCTAWLRNSNWVFLLQDCGCNTTTAGTSQFRGFNDYFDRNFLNYLVSFLLNFPWTKVKLGLQESFISREMRRQFWHSMGTPDDVDGKTVFYESCLPSYFNLYSLESIKKPLEY